jgi:hypothetical protein
VNNFDFILPIETLKNGKFTIGVAIVDPKTRQPAVKFAMKNPRQDLIQELGSFELNRILP